MAGNVGFESDSFYVQDCRTVQNNIHAIQTLTGQISKKVASFESEKDFLDCRSMVDRAVKQAIETNVVLARIREHSQNVREQVERSNRRQMYRKLSDNLAITARVLEDVIRRYQTEESRRPSLKPQFADADMAGGEEQLLTGADEDAEKGGVVAFQPIEEEMRSLQRIYKDLAVTAEESQATFESLETHMASASADVESAFAEIPAMSPPLVRRLQQNPVAVVGGGLAFMVFCYVLS